MAVAQQAADGLYDLGTLVLEGTKQDRDYISTAASVGVLDSYRLEEQGITDLRDTFDLLGNVHETEGESGNALFTIRGLSAQGVTETSNSAPLTSMVIDGVPQTVRTMRRGARGLWDMEQVEVYRGPQSTLQGRGALAGAVVVQSKDPTFVPEWDSRVILGQNNRREAAFAWSGPLIEDELAFRISGESRYRKRGVTYNLPQAEFFGEDKYQGLRGKLLYTPKWAPELSVKLTLSDVYDRPGQSVSSSANPYDRVYTTSATSRLESREGDSFSAVLETEYDFGNDLRLTSVTSYLDADTRIRSVPGSSYHRESLRGDENITQDFRLNFGSDDTRFSGVVGVMVGRFKQPRPRDLITDSGVVLQDIVSEDSTDHRSIYADVDWHPADALTFNFGGRLVYEKVVNEGVSKPAALNGFVQKELNASTSDTVFLPQLGATLNLSDTQTLSYSFRRGYRSGFNAFQGASVSGVHPEFLSSNEIAYRVEDPGGSWRFGVTGFFSEYKDQQVVVSSAGNPTVTENAGRSRVYGVEIEGDYGFDNGVSLFGSVGYLRTEFVDFQVGLGDYNGNEFPQAPRATAALGLSYEGPSGAFGSLMGTFSSSYFSPGKEGLENNPDYKVPSYVRFDAQAGYRWNNAELVFYVDNLLDADYITSISCDGRCEHDVSEPRTIGLELRARY